MQCMVKVQISACARTHAQYIKALLMLTAADTFFPAHSRAHVHLSHCQLSQ